MPRWIGQLNEEKMRWWREARFGIFVHWGLYSLLGGIWEGRRIPGYSEWIRYRARIPKKKYESLAAKFNPVNYRPEEWASIIKKSGAKYVIITAKHHDGFCMFETKSTKFNIVDSSSFRRDVIKELASACRKEGLKFGIYYSQLDWHMSDRLSMFPKYKNFPEYINYMKQQLRELLTNYGTIDILFFDGDWMPQWNHKIGQEIELYCRSLQPKIIINDRVGKRPWLAYVRFAPRLYTENPYGDYLTPEQFVSRTALHRDWETNMTMNDSFGYKSWSNSWKSTKELINYLVDTSSKGGNFLLNIGPDGTGKIPYESEERLSQIGKWLETNGLTIFKPT